MEDLVSSLLIPTSSRDYISKYLDLFFISVKKDKDPEGCCVLKLANSNHATRFSNGVVTHSSQKNIRLTNFHDTVDFSDEIFKFAEDFHKGLYSGFHSLSFRIESETLKIFQLKQELVNFELVKVNQTTSFVDLSMGFDEYFKLLKPAVKRDVEKGFKHFRYKLVTNYRQFMLNYSQLHGGLSGGQISKYSWSILLNSLENDRATAIEVEYEGRFAGGAIFSTGMKTAHYTNGAFDRQLFPLPITHGLFIKAFQELYLSGHKLVVLDDFFSDQFEDEKKANIRKFKKNFCNSSLEREVYQIKIISKG